jgi:N-acetylglucosaminyl-diphospho-decaprenol L-rhamnosyltransferase
MVNQPHLAVIVVTWNVRDMALDCLRSVFDDFDRTRAQGSVWVVDNASTDETAEAIRAAFPPADTPNLAVLTPGENLGFAGANNLALRRIGFPDGGDLPDYVLLLNPDTYVRAGAFQALIDGMERTGAGLAGARLSYDDGAFQHGAFGYPGLMQLIVELFPVPGRLVESRLNGRYPREWYEADEPFEIGHPLGAVFMLRREAIQRTGLFDERFEMYCEEIDWAMRIRAAGWPVVCVPSAEIVHYAGQSSAQARPRTIVSLWTSRLLLYRKHYGAPKNLLARWIIRAGMNRLIKTTARDSSLSEADRAALVDAYREVIRRSRDGVRPPIAHGT